jgi:hypothetical protein
MDCEGLEAKELQLTELFSFDLTRRCKVLKLSRISQYLDPKFCKERITLYAEQGSEKVGI